MARNALGTMIVANLDPRNDVAQLDCDDADPVQGVRERCGDGADSRDYLELIAYMDGEGPEVCYDDIDNNCDGLIDDEDPSCV